MPRAGWRPRAHIALACRRGYDIWIKARTSPTLRCPKTRKGGTQRHQPIGPSALHIEDTHGALHNYPHTRRHAERNSTPHDRVPNARSRRIFRETSMDARTLSNFKSLLHDQNDVDLMAMLATAETRRLELADVIRLLKAEIVRRRITH